MNKRAYFRKYITKADQKEGTFCPTPLQAIRAHTIINECIFSNKLSRPKIYIQKLDDAWGICHGDLDDGSYPPFIPRCNYIVLNSSFYNWRHFIEVLAHEMVHQYQWDIYRWEHQELYGREMPTESNGHGPSFFMWRDRFAQYGLTLKTANGQKRWFDHQDFAKC